MERNKEQKFNLADFSKQQEERKTEGIYKAMYDEARATFQNMGYNLADSNIIDKRALIADSIQKVDGKLQFKFNQIADLNFKSDILKQCQTFTNIVSNMAIPIVEDTDPQWLTETGALVQTTPNVDSVKFSPKRLQTSINVSKQVTKQRETDYDIISAINGNMENKLISTIFSTNSTENQPHGIFKEGNCAGTFTNIEDIAELAYNVQSNKGMGVYIISPKAKQIILNENINALNTEKFMGENYIINPLMEDGIIAYVDLSKLNVTEWGYIDLTIDNITLATNGQDIYYLTGYYDFNLTKDEFCSWIDLEP